MPSPRRRAVDEVLVTWAGYQEQDPGTGGRLLAAGLRLRLEPKTGARDVREVARLAAGAVAAIVSTDPFDAAVFAAAPRLRVVARVGVGTDSIDLEAATAAGVVVTVTPGANQETAADHTIALILAALRRVTEHDAAVRRGEWPRGGDLTPWDLNGATVGLVGYGAIGRAVGRRLAGFSVRLLIADPAATAAPGAELVALDVFSDEPAIPRVLRSRPDVTLTPHIGGLSDRSIRRMTELATESVLQVLGGDPDPARVANPGVLAS